MSEPSEYTEELLVQLRSALLGLTSFITESLADPERWSDAEIIRIRELVRTAQSALQVP